MSKKSAKNSKLVFREFPLPEQKFHSLIFVSTLRIDALSSIRSSLIGQAMESSYQACNLEYGKLELLFRTTIYITNSKLGTGSDKRRKKIINSTLEKEKLFEDLMSEFRKRFGDLAIDLQNGIEAAIETHLDVIQRMLDIIKSENITRESEQDPEFRGRVESEIEIAQEKIRQIQAAIVS